MNTRNTLFAAMAIFAIGSSVQASAAETSSTFQATASVASSCAIMGAGNLDFGSYDAVVTNRSEDKLSSSSGVEVRCNGGTVATVQVDQGLNPDASSSCDYPSRAMISAQGGRLSYSLSSTADYQDTLGCDATTEKVLSFANLETQNLGVFGRIGAGQDAPVGSYTDSVTVKVVF